MKFRNFMWLLLLAALWGPSFIFIKVAVTEIPPLTLVAGRVSLAAILLVLILRWQGRRLPGLTKNWRHFAVMALFSNALPFVLISWGEMRIDSALAAILNGTTPLFTLVLAHLFVADDRITPAKAAGVLVGFGGLLLLIAPSLLGGVQASTWGFIAVTVACASYGVGMIYARNNLRGVPPLIAPAAQLLAATLYLLPLALFLERPFSHPLPTWPALGSLLALAVLGTCLAFIVYYRILEQTSATYLSMVTYLLPVIGAILGVVVLAERLAWNAYIGCMLILLGVMLVNGAFKMIRWQRLTGLKINGAGRSG